VGAVILCSLPKENTGKQPPLLQGEVGTSTSLVVKFLLDAVVGVDTCSRVLLRKRSSSNHCFFVESGLIFKVKIW
jgi:hypothetical protein